MIAVIGNKFVAQGVEAGRKWDVLENRLLLAGNALPRAMWTQQTVGRLAPRFCGSAVTLLRSQSSQARLGSSSVRRYPFASMSWRTCSGTALPVSGPVLSTLPFWAGTRTRAAEPNQWSTVAVCCFAICFLS